MKRIFTALIFIFASNLDAHDTDGFFVIPVPIGEACEVLDPIEVCNGTPISGDEVFTIQLLGRFNLGDLYSTPNGLVIEIVGRSSGDEFYNGFNSITFKRSSTALPAAQEGVKGTLFGIFAGRVFHARFL